MNNPTHAGLKRQFPFIIYWPPWLDSQGRFCLKQGFVQDSSGITSDSLRCLTWQSLIQSSGSPPWVSNVAAAALLLRLSNNKEERSPLSWKIHLKFLQTWLITVLIDISQSGFSPHMLVVQVTRSDHVATAWGVKGWWSPQGVKNECRKDIQPMFTIMQIIKILCVYWVSSTFEQYCIYLVWSNIYVIYSKIAESYWNLNF